jgi:type I restriction enzyme R subunit
MSVPANHQANARANAQGAAAIRLTLSRLLSTLGWQYVAPDLCRERRRHNNGPLLEDSLLRFWRSRRLSHLGQAHAWSAQALDTALKTLKQSGIWPSQNRVLHQMLKTGVPVQELLPGDNVLSSGTIPLIDWDQPQQNIFEISTEFVASGQQEAIDIVCFVNGLPLCLIHTQDDTQSDPVLSGIRRHMACQSGRRVPSPYYFASLLLSLSLDEGRFGPVLAGEPFWHAWYEEQWNSAELARRVNAALPEETENALLAEWRGAQNDGWRTPWQVPRVPTMADQLVIGLLTPLRLIEYLDWAVVTEQAHNDLRFARSHQYFAVKAILARLALHQPTGLPNHLGSRAGGVVWHSAGSGKSLTMVFLLQALRRDPQLRDCRVIVVTDRVDLEDQLASNFLKYGATEQHYRPANDGKLRVRSGKELAQKIGSGSERLIFAMLHKFNAALMLEHCRNPSDKIIVLVDEAHRSHGGQLHERMRRVFKRAAFVAFTGTPLLKQEKTRQQFGPLIHGYPMQLALQQRMVTPLWYEERRPELQLAPQVLERWLDHAGLDAEQQAIWRQRWLRPAQLHGALARIRAIAEDIALHFHATIKQTGSGLKGMVAVSSRADAVRYHYFLQQTGLVNCAIIMSPPQAEDDEGLEVAESTESSESSESAGAVAGAVEGAIEGPLSVSVWWQTHVGRQQAAYEAHCLKQYAHSNDLDLLIVVDRLLTGFDQARAAVLYLDKALQDHGLIQAISRINRLHPAKNVGLLIDYRANLRALDSALLAYQQAPRQTDQRTQQGTQQALPHERYDVADLVGLYYALPGQIARLPQLLQQVQDCCPTDCPEQLEPWRQALQPAIEAGRYDKNQKRRSDFFAALRQFETCLRLAWHAADAADVADASDATDGVAQPQDLAYYQQRLAFFTELAQLVRHDANKAQGNSTPDAAHHWLDQVVQQVTIRGDTARYQWAAPEAAHAVFGGLAQDAAANARHMVAGLAEGGAGAPAATPEPEQAQRAAALLHTRLTKRITVELDDDPYAQQVFARRLQQETSPARTQQADPLGQLQALQQLERQVLARQVAGVPSQLYGQPLACACYGLLLLHEQAGLLTEGEPQVAMIEMVQQVQTEFGAMALQASGAERNIFRCVNFALFPLLGAQGALALARRMVQLTRQHAGLPLE